MTFQEILILADMHFELKYLHNITAGMQTCFMLYHILFFQGIHAALLVILIADQIVRAIFCLTAVFWCVKEF
jgi:hypothetical protein